MKRVIFLSVAALWVTSCTGTEPTPAVIVGVTWPGASVENVERALTTPLEEAIAQAQRGELKAIERVSSTSSAGSARVRVCLARGTDALAATAALRAHIEQMRTQLPADVDVPTLTYESGAARPAYRFVTTSNDDTLTLVQRSEVLRALGRQLERAPGVVRLELERGALHEWHVDVDATRATALGLTAMDIADVVRTEVNASTSSTLDASALSQATLRKQADGAVIRIADVARIEDGTRPSSDAWPPNGSPPSLIVYVDARAPADIDDRIAGETMHARSVLGPGYDFQRAPITAREGVAVVVTGPEHGIVRDAARALHPLAQATAGVRDVDAVPIDQPELVVDVDRARAADLGVRAADVARAYALATAGEVVRPRVFDAPPVRVRTADASTSPNDALRAMAVRATSGASVPLDAVVALRAGSAPVRLERLDRMPALWMCAGVDVDGAQDQVVSALRTALAKAPLPAGVTVQVERGCAH